MSYPRNAASPERVDIGPVIQISDGAVQTAGVAVKVIPFGGTEAAGAGTVAYSADGVVLYTPTQAETNYTSFILVASKSGCIPASKTVVTSASGTAGYAGLDWSKITAPTTTVGLTGTTISTSQVVASVSGAVGSVTGSVGSVTGAVGSVTSRVTANADQWGGVAVTGMPMPTYTQPTGFLTATFPTILASTTNITAATGIVLSPVTHTGARIPNVTLVDTTTVNIDMRGTDGALLAWSYTAPLNTAGTAAAVWNALLATYTTSGSFGARVMRLDSASSGNEAKVTGAGHVAADLHELQPGVITAADFSANWLTAAGTAADYITELQTAIGTATNQTAILDRQGFTLAALVGTISDAQTAAETYAIVLGANTFTVDFTGLDASGNRTGQTLTKV